MADTLENKLDEVMQLLNELPEEPADAGREAMSKEERIAAARAELGAEERPLTPQENAMAEFAKMMEQWDAMLKDYQRMEAEEEAERIAAEGGADAEETH